MSVVTEDMVEAVWAREVEPLAQLIEINADGLVDPIRVSDCPDRLLSGFRRGLSSNGEDYPYMPFRLTWAGATQDQPFGQGRVAIANVDSRIEAAMEASVNPPTISLRLIRISAPDVIETAIEGATIGQSDFTEVEASAVIRPRDFDLEPACAVSYTPATTPGQF